MIDCVGSVAKECERDRPLPVRLVSTMSHDVLVAVVHDEPRSYECGDVIGGVRRIVEARRRRAYAFSFFRVIGHGLRPVDSNVRPMTTR